MRRRLDMKEAERNERQERIDRHDVELDYMLEDGEDVSEEEVWAKGFGQVES
jgi:hypothetical protein